MFIYEKGNTINISLTGSKPVETPDVVINGYTDGATLTVGSSVYGKGSKVFDCKAKTLVYQKDEKLMITFRGIEGMTDPEITVDEIEDNVFDVVVCGEAVRLSIVDDEVVVGESTKTDEEVTPVKEEPEVQDEVLEGDVVEEQPEEVVEE